jgi:hypothetical protein
MGLVNVKLGPPPNFLRCWKCEKLKAPNEFHNDKTKHWGLSGECKKCRYDALKVWRKSNPERDTTNRLRERTRNKLKRRLKGWREKGIVFTLEEYSEIKTKQGGKCAICFRSDEGHKKALAVDHDHRTGKVRGLLCGSCNLGIGYFKDSVDLLKSAIGYLNDRTNNIG